MTTSYDGNCHCKAVTFTVTIPHTLETLPSQITKCNCSICSRNGYLLIHGPKTMTALHKGEDSLTSYTFGNKNGIHKFCKVCGTSVMIFAPEGVDGMGVNIRCLKGVDVDKLEYKFNDGWNKGMSGPYEE